MGNYLRMEKRQQIETLVQLGWSARAIHRQTGIDRETIRKYREGDKGAGSGATENPPEVPADFLSEKGQNPPKVPAGSEQEGAVQPAESLPLPGTHSASVQPHLQRISTKRHQGLSAQRIYQDLVEEHGYKGSYDSVKRYVRKLRRRYRRYYERLPHLPGREAQVDFGRAPCWVRINDRYRRVWLFKMTLSSSKHAYEELVEHQDLETFLRCHERAFAFFGGVPEVVTLDNLKSGVLQACLYDPTLNATYLAFSRHWGFAANPCIPRKPEHKGIVERDIGYTKSNALLGRRFEGLQEANLFLRHWNKRWARTRIHGSTKCQVWKMFVEVERPVLRPLAEKPFEYFHPGKRKVDVTGFIEVKGCHYAVPPRYVGETVVVHFNQSYVKIFHEQRLLITHRRLHGKAKISRPDSCLPKWKHPSQESQERYYCRCARKVGEDFHQVVYQVLCQNDPLAIRRVRGVLSLARRYGNELAERAAGQACLLRAYSYRSLKAYCERLQSHKEEPSGRLTQNHELIRPLDEYQNIVIERTDS